MKDRFKFRFWHKPTSKMLDCYGFNEHCTFANTLDGIGTEYNPCATKDCELMQCTGLKDKNGKLIYEGDIVKFAEYDWTDFSFKDWEQETTEVVWGGEHSYPAFDLKAHNFDCNGLAYIFEEGWTIEVIGNIYENKELLNE